jgi:hypothetical protein
MESAIMYIVNRSYSRGESDDVRITFGDVKIGEFFYAYRFSENKLNHCSVSKIGSSITYRHCFYSFRKINDSEASVIRSISAQGYKNNILKRHTIVKFNNSDKVFPLILPFALPKRDDLKKHC